MDVWTFEKLILWSGVAFLLTLSALIVGYMLLMQS
jgi:hypothetical protein